MPLMLRVPSFENGAAIPGRFAFGKHDADDHVVLSDNLNPHLVWSGAPEGTRSFALLCVDDKVPSKGDDVNQEGKTVPADLERVDFYHWVVADIGAETTEILEGSVSEGVIPGGKGTGASELGTVGKNDYSAWFEGDPDMEGVYGGYDGPCPPWNDSLVHRYTFKLFALDVERLSLPEDFGGPELLAAIQGRVLAEASHEGTYAINPAAQH